MVEKSNHGNVKLSPPHRPASRDVISSFLSLTDTPHLDPTRIDGVAPRASPKNSGQLGSMQDARLRQLNISGEDGVELGSGQLQSPPIVPCISVD
jgi:hypothetical protein